MAVLDLLSQETQGTGAWGEVAGAQDPSAGAQGAGVFRGQMQMLRAQVLMAQVQVHRGSGHRCGCMGRWRRRVGGREGPPGRRRSTEQRKSL